MTITAPVVTVSAICASCDRDVPPWVILTYVQGEYRAESMCVECFSAWLRLALAGGGNLRHAPKSR